MSDTGPLERKHREWLCTRGQCLKNGHVKTKAREQGETNNYGIGRHARAHVFRAKEGVTSHGLLCFLGCSFCPTAKVVGKRTLVTPVLPQHGVWHRRMKVLCARGAYCESPWKSSQRGGGTDRELLLTQKESRALLRARKCPTSYPLGAGGWSEAWARNEDIFSRLKRGRSHPSYFKFAFSQRNSCSFSPMNLCAIAGFTCACSMAEF